MGCNCGKGRSRYEVQHNGKKVFAAASRTLAESVAKRYPGAVVVDTQA